MGEYYYSRPLCAISTTGTPALFAKIFLEANKFTLDYFYWN